MESILVSACLLGECCRYDGKGKKNDGICRLAENPQLCLIPVCPEQLGGLPTPRPPAERVGDRVRNSRGEDVTAAFERGARRTLEIALQNGCTTAVLKERSPSCGSGEIYDGSFSGRLTAGDGITAQLLKENGITVFGESQYAPKE